MALRPIHQVSPLFCALIAAGSALAGDITLIKDIGRSGFGSYPSNFFELAPDRIFFSATDPIAGRELWITDGTTSGTRLVKDLVPGVGDSNPGGFRAVGNRVFFGATPQQCYTDIWSTDGT
ncbi:MAG TPA: ELWxxDGT repeat protein, partial [Phycisphaerales bacterium]|nr:ELWxxDGT repeat protein [Phycisphaerales bacterium]